MDQPTEIGDWKHLANLGAGSFGVVMLWKNKSSEDFIAVKMCKFQKQDTLSLKQRDRWCQEVEFLKSIHHLNVVGAKVLDPILETFLNKFNPSKLPLLCMEYCKNGNLRKYMTNAPIKLCGLYENDVRYILQDILGGLSYLHSKKIIHRDIKPENIVLQFCNNRKCGNIFKIIDLGYAKELNDATLSFVGTLHYLAPEIFYSQNYDHSVDYWSLGNMVFEVICGVLPFLPELAHFERYEQIKQKGNDDVCIYLSSSGSLVYSSEIQRENFITISFRKNIELWLKVVLQYDPTKRNFGNNKLSALDYLKFILDKKIVEIFYVYKQEFLSYEVYSNTCHGTLKNWIARDVKEPKDNLFFIWCNYQVKFKSDDNELIDISLLNNDGISLYVYNRDALCSEKLTSNSKMFGLKEFFNINFKFHTKSLKTVYRQALFYIHTELRIFKELESSCLSIKEHLEFLLNLLKDKFMTATIEFKNLLSDMASFIYKEKNDLTEVAILSRIQCMVACLNWQANGIINVAAQCKKLFRIKCEVIKASDLIKSSFSGCDIQSIFNKINSKGFLALEKLSPNTYDVLWNRIKAVVSDTIKKKYNFDVTDQTPLNYLKKNFATLIWAEKLLPWLDNFIYNNNILTFNYANLQKECTKYKCEKQNLSKSVLKYNSGETRQIILENGKLRCQFETMMEKCLQNFKN